MGENDEKTGEAELTMGGPAFASLSADGAPKVDWKKALAEEHRKRLIEMADAKGKAAYAAAEAKRARRNMKRLADDHRSHLGREAAKKKINLAEEERRWNSSRSEQSRT